MEIYRRKRVALIKKPHRLLPCTAKCKSDNPVLVPFTYGEALEGVEIVPDFSQGDQQITVPEGLLAKSAVVKQPESLISENVKKGVSVAGVEGTYEGDLPDLQTLDVELDFSDGDMEILPGVGEVFSKVNIPKPVNLIPENIAEGVDIAGIIGTLAAGGNVAFGTFTGSKSVEQTIAHNLGMIPDVVFVTPMIYVKPSTGDAGACCFFSTKFSEKIGSTYKGYIFQMGSSAFSGLTAQNGYEVANNGYINDPTTTEFTVGKNYFTEGRLFFWLAFGDST